MFYSNLVRKTTVSEIFDSEKCREIEIRVKMSLKVIESDTDRSATYDFLLTFHSTMGLSLTVSEINGDFSRKSQIFPTPCILRPTDGIPPELDIGVMGQEN